MERSLWVDDFTIVPFLRHFARRSLSQQRLVEHPVAHPRRRRGELLPGLQLVRHLGTRLYCCVVPVFLARGGF